MISASKINKKSAVSNGGFCCFSSGRGRMTGEKPAPCQAVAQRNEPQKQTVGNRSQAGPQHLQRNRAGNGPRNEPRNGDDRVGHVNGQLAARSAGAVVNAGQQLGIEHDGNGLVAESAAGRDAGDNHRGEQADFPCGLADFFLHAIEHVRALKNPGKGAGQENRQADLEHGQKPAARQNIGQRAALRRIADDSRLERFPQRKVLQKHGSREYRCDQLPGKTGGTRYDPHAYPRHHHRQFQRAYGTQPGCIPREISGTGHLL